MAAALGFLLGAGLNIAGGYGKEKAAERARQEEHKSALADLVVQQGLQSGDKSFFTMPETKKLIEGKFGPGTPETLGTLTEALNKPLAGFPQFGGGGSAQPSPSTQMIGSAGGQRFSQPQQIVGKVPSQMPPMQVTGPGSPPEPTNVNPPQQAQQQFYHGGGDQDDPQQIRDHMDAVRSYMVQNPGNARVQDLGKTELEYWKDRLADVQKEQEFDITKSQQLMEFGITKQMQQQFHDDSVQMHQQTLASLEQNRAFMQQMQRESQDTKKQALFDQSSKNIASQTESISKMLFSANPADAETAKTLLKQRNAQARDLKRQADAAGLNYDPEEFKPLTTETIPGWWKSHIGIGPSSTRVTEDTSAAASDAAAGPSPALKTDDPLIGSSTAQPDGTYPKGGKNYVVKGRKIVGYTSARPAG